MQLYVDVDYLHVLDHLRAREFDATMWGNDALRELDDLTVMNFRTPEARAAAPMATAAAIVATRGFLVAAFPRSELDGGLVVRARSEVLAGSRVPSD